MNARSKSASERADAFAERARGRGLVVERETLPTGSTALEVVRIKRDTSAYAGSLLAVLDAGEWVTAYFGTGPTGRSRFVGGREHRSYLRSAGRGREIRTLRALDLALECIVPVERKTGAAR